MEKLAGVLQEAQSSWVDPAGMLEKAASEWAATSIRIYRGKLLKRALKISETIIRFIDESKPRAGGEI